MKTDILINSKELYLSSIVKAETRKATDTRVSRITLTTLVLFTIAMSVVGIFNFEIMDSWTGTFSTISSPACTILPIIFIFLLCEEWTHGTALVTYTFIPQRNKVILAKFFVLITFFIGTVIILYVLSAITSIIASNFDIGLIYWSEPISSIFFLMMPLLVNMLFGFSVAILIHETSFAIALYFIIPPATVIAAQLPIIGPYAKWISLEHSSSIFIAGASGVTTAQYICSLFVWILIPCIIGIIRNIKEDLN